MSFLSLLHVNSIQQIVKKYSILQPTLTYIAMVCSLFCRKLSRRKIRRESNLDFHVIMTLKMFVTLVFSISRSLYICFYDCLFRSSLSVRWPGLRALLSTPVEVGKCPTLYGSSSPPWTTKSGRVSCSNCSKTNPSIKWRWTFSNCCVKCSTRICLPKWTGHEIPAISRS